MFLAVQLLTSSEVELMETPVVVLVTLQSTTVLLTSSEVELMETGSSLLVSGGIEDF